MVPPPNPLPEALEVTRRAAADAISHNGETTVDDRGDHWVFEFIPRGDGLGGGARVVIAKDGLRVLKVVRGQ